MIQDPDPIEVLVLSSTKPVAKVKHECCHAFCKEPIKAGERYHRVVYIDDDGRFHSDCEHLRHVHGY